MIPGWKSVPAFLRRCLADLSGMFFPPVCPVCHNRLVDGEETLCMECHWKIPRTDYHQTERNALAFKLTDLKTPIERCGAYFFYSHTSPYSQLIRDAKYNRRPELNQALARMYATELLAAGFFEGIDLIVPVPVHWIKRLRRGYNQTEYIARGLSQQTGIPVADDILRARAHSTQTRKSASERRLAAESVFTVHPEALTRTYCASGSAGSSHGVDRNGPKASASGYPEHILLVDDVITTGSTILNCARQLHSAFPRARISVLSLATTRL